VANDGRIVARGASESTAISNLFLNVADDRTLRALRDGKDVSNRESCLLASVNKCPGMKTFRGDKGLLPQLVSVRVAKNNAREWCASAAVISNTKKIERLSLPPSVVDNLFHYTTDVAIAFSIV